MFSGHRVGFNVGRCSRDRIKPKAHSCSYIVFISGPPVEGWHQFVWLLMGPKSLILSGGVNRGRRGRFLFLIWGKPAKTDSIKNKRWILLTPQMFEVYVKIQLAQKVQVVTEQVCCSLQLHYTCLYTTRYSSMRTIIRQILMIIIQFNSNSCCYYSY